MKVCDLFSGIGKQLFSLSVGCYCLFSGYTQAQDRGIRMVHDSSLHEVAQFLMHELSFKIDLAVRKGELPAWKDAKRTLRYTGAESQVLFYDSAEIDLFAPDGSSEMVKGYRMEWREIERWHSFSLDGSGSLMIAITPSRKVWFELAKLKTLFPIFGPFETVLGTASLPLNYSSFQESFKIKNDSLSYGIIAMANAKNLGVYWHPWLQFPYRARHIYGHFEECKYFHIPNSQQGGKEYYDSATYAQIGWESIVGYYFYNESSTDSGLHLTFRSLSVYIPQYVYARNGGEWQVVNEYPASGYDNLIWLDCSELKQKLPPADYQFLETLNRYFLLNAKALFQNEYIEPW